MKPLTKWQALTVIVVAWAICFLGIVLFLWVVGEATDGHRNRVQADKMEQGR